MKLIAVKWICDQTPEGAQLEVPDNDGHLLIQMGLARELTADEPATNAPSTADPAVPATDTAPRRSGYRRRDLQADKPR